jgi:hypothetical protein
MSWDIFGGHDYKHKNLNKDCDMNIRELIILVLFSSDMMF